MNGARSTGNKLCSTSFTFRYLLGRAIAGVVIVEDEIQVLISAESVLQQAGHATVSAATVAEAQAIINSQDERFDLLITDIELGSHAEGGLTIGKMVRETREETPVLYTSGHRPPTGCKSCLSSRACSSRSRTPPRT